MTRPVPIASGTRVVVDGWLATRVVGRWWHETIGEWSYRITHDRSRKAAAVLFHVRHSELGA